MLYQLKAHTQNFSGMSGRHEWSSLDLSQLNSTGLRCTHMHHQKPVQYPITNETKACSRWRGWGREETDYVQNTAVLPTDYLNLRSSAQSYSRTKFPSLLYLLPNNTSLIALVKLFQCSPKRKQSILQNLWGNRFNWNRKLPFGGKKNPDPISLSLSVCHSPH